MRGIVITNRSLLFRASPGFAAEVSIPRADDRTLKHAALVVPDKYRAAQRRLAGRVLFDTAPTEERMLFTGYCAGLAA
ncbi:hypothetical protein SADO_05725 [Salinisphaera dokdonensis CL-ES53]|uniref:Uncharacterized protein n=1 Tax=Salinisphaera dokdonensis CL-ES53 TaxID=1304272 RepID=A0ABV2B011_9GAMM